MATSTTLYYVEPIFVEGTPVTPLVEIANWQGKTSLSSWALQFIATPCIETRTDLFKCQVRLAHEALALFGPLARAKLAESFSTIASNSPNLSASSRRNLARPDLVDTVLRYAAYHAKSPREAAARAWVPLDLEKENHIYSDIYGSHKRLPRAAILLYVTLTSYILHNRLDPHCFSVTYKRIATYCGFRSKDTVFKALTAAQQAGLLFRVDQGTATFGGLPTMLTFVGMGETLQDAYDAAIATDGFAQRLQYRAAHKLPPAQYVVRDNRVTRI